MEIGSEYWLNSANITKSSGMEYFYNLGKDRKFVLSGRTAIDLVLKQIRKYSAPKTVYMPSYCCESMLLPFIDNNIKIIFYEVDFNNTLSYDIDTDKKCDIFFAMNYFGFTSTNMDYYIRKFKERKTIIIEDITHSLLSDIPYSGLSDYLIASLRKWFPIITGGMAINVGNYFDIDISAYKAQDELVNIKKEAMLEKYKYINSLENIDKQQFLAKYRMAESILDVNYKESIMDKESINILNNLNIEEIIKTRRRNAKLIYDMLLGFDGIKMLVKDIKEEDTPLFVPIIVEKTRDRLRKYLIEKQIYCPVHWEMPNILVTKSTNIYENELSLICDQRYKEEDIEQYIKYIINFVKQ